MTLVLLLCAGVLAVADEATPLREARVRAATTGHSHVAEDTRRNTRAIVYIFNASGRTWTTVRQPVRANGREIVKLARGEYAVTTLDPGIYRFRAAGGKCELSLKRAQEYFLVFAYHPGRNWPAPVSRQVLFFNTVPEAKARELLARYRRRASRW